MATFWSGRMNQFFTLIFIAATIVALIILGGFSIYGFMCFLNSI